MANTLITSCPGSRAYVIHPSIDPSVFVHLQPNDQLYVIVAKAPFLPYSEAHRHGTLHHMQGKIFRDGALVAACTKPRHFTVWICILYC